MNSFTEALRRILVKVKQFRLVVALTVAVLVAVAVILPASAAPYCSSGQSPQFSSRLAELKLALGDPMGEPTECLHENAENGDLLQQTTTGLAYVRAWSGIPTFTNGGAHWGLYADQLFSWSGGSVDPATVPAGPTGLLPAGSPALSVAEVVRRSRAAIRYIRPAGL